METLGEPPQLSIVPFQHVPAGHVDRNAHNARLALALQNDGRFWVAPATIDNRVYLRPCFVNYRTTDEDVLALVDIAREVGAARRGSGDGVGRLGGAADGARQRSASISGTGVAQLGKHLVGAGAGCQPRVPDGAGRPGHPRVRGELQQRLVAGRALDFDEAAAFLDVRVGDQLGDVVYRADGGAGR